MSEISAVIPEKTRFWEDLRRQENVLGLKIKKGTIQDAAFITADPGDTPADKLRGVQARTRILYKLFVDFLQ